MDIVTQEVEKNLLEKLSSELYDDFDKDFDINEIVANYS